MIKLDYSGVEATLKKKDWHKDEPLQSILSNLNQNLGKTYEFTTWLNLPDRYDREEFRRIKSAANKIQGEADVLLVIGVGGSYLSAKAAIELLRSPNYNLIPKATPNIYFVGNNLSAEHLNEIGYLLKGKNFSVNVISKSGETLETAIAFRIFCDYLINRYGDKGAASRIYVTTDRQNGLLREMCAKEGYESFIIPDKIGGRYSALTAVGLLPMATAGIDIDQVMAGAFDAMERLTTDFSLENAAIQYAAIRQGLSKKGKAIEVLSSYEPAFFSMCEWWKQLFGESEGKEGGGIFPASMSFTSDLHSLGQYMQEGTRNIMQTIVSFEEFRRDIEVPQDKDDLDKLNYLAGKKLNAINQIAKEASKRAHIDGGVPTLELTFPNMTDNTFGYMLYFFMLACALSASLQGVNPFDQPGVEAYKKNMFALLEKPE